MDEFDYLNVKYLLDYIDVGNELSLNHRNILIQESEMELLNDLDLICQLPQRGSVVNSDVLSTPASGRVFDVSSSPSVRHNQSPK